MVSTKVHSVCGYIRSTASPVVTRSTGTTGGEYVYGTICTGARGEYAYIYTYVRSPPVVNTGTTGGEHVRGSIQHRNGN